uniref:Cytochrome c oxidase assembly protein COX20, mitochondrial n=1 Tax=Glossina morsitans morsitans TaxID=37546 RepID=A0A1B0G853_GLOMM
MEDEPKKGLSLFGRDVSEIPCFRNSFLYGIGGGIGTGLLTFLSTSRTTFSTHVGFGTFFVGTLVYWSWCRYQWSLHRFEYAKLQEGLRNKALYEGTDVEKKLELKSA